MFSNWSDAILFEVCYLFNSYPKQKKYVRRIKIFFEKHLFWNLLILVENKLF